MPVLPVAGTTPSVAPLIAPPPHPCKDSQNRLLLGSMLDTDWDSLVPQATSIEGWGGDTCMALVDLESGLIRAPVSCFLISHTLSPNTCNVGTVPVAQ